MSAPSAADIADALNGRPSGSGYVCECPAHVDLRPSLSVTSRDGRVLVHCHAGCAQSAVIGALRRRGLMGRRDRPGLEARQCRIADTTDTSDAPTPPILGAERDPMRSWRGAMPFSRGCVADLYLERRGLELTDGEARSLKYAPSLWHWPTRTRWPAMLARVTSAAGEELTTHQTFLARDGQAKRRSATRPACSRRAAVGRAAESGSATPRSGARVHRRRGHRIPALGPAALRRRGGCAALSEGGIRRLILPPAAKKIRIFADHDIKGQGLAAAQAAKRRWTAEGREVAISISPVIGWDANDTLLHRLGRP